jgi:hypothetical protein
MITFSRTLWTVLGLALPVIAMMAVLALPVAAGSPLLTTNPLGPSATGVPANKQAKIQKMADADAAAQAATTTKAQLAAKAADTGSTTARIATDPGAYVDPHFPVGSGMVIAVTDPPEGDMSIVVSNMWSHENPWMFVYAGRDAADTSLGVIVIRDEDSQTARLVVPGHGALTITGGWDTSLTLTGADGASVSLDLATQAVSS